MKNSNNELREYVESIAAELKAMYEGNFTDEELEVLEENGEAADLYEYFAENALDVEYTISGNGGFLGARIAVTLGGPNVWVDTREGCVKGYWGSDREEAWIPSEVCDEINFIFEESYNCMK